MSEQNESFSQDAVSAEDMLAKSRQSVVRKEQDKINADRYSAWTGVKDVEIGPTSSKQTKSESSFAGYLEDRPVSAEDISSQDEPQGEYEPISAMDTDLTALQEMFAESDDKEHRQSSLELLDDFADQYGLDRQQERALRDYLLSIDLENTSSKEESVVTGAVKEESVEDEEEVDAAAEEQAEQLPKGLWQRLKDRVSEAMTDTRIFIWGPNSGDEFLSTDEQEKIRSQRIKFAIIAGGLTVAAAGVSYALMKSGNHEAARAISAHRVKIETVAETHKAIMNKLSYSGDTIWYHAKHFLQTHGIKHPSNARVEAYTHKILRVNKLSWADAKHLPTGFKFKMPSIK